MGDLKPFFIAPVGIIGTIRAARTRRRGLALPGPGSAREVQAAGLELHFHGTNDMAHAQARTRREPQLESAFLPAKTQVPSPRATPREISIFEAWKRRDVHTLY